MIDKIIYSVGILVFVYIYWQLDKELVNECYSREAKRTPSLLGFFYFIPVLFSPKKYFIKGKIITGYVLSIIQIFLVVLIILFIRKVVVSG